MNGQQFELAPEGRDTVLALHSSLSTKAQWGGLAGCLGSDYRVIAIDLHGYGSSPLPPEHRAISLSDEADLAARRVIAAIGSFQQVHVVGHAYGAAVALSLARTCPELVRSLVLYEPACFRLLDHDGPHYHVLSSMAVRVARHVDRGELAEGARAYLEFWGAGATYDSADAEAREGLHQAVRKVPLDFAALFNAPRNSGWYSRISVPTLLLSGRYSPESAREVSRILWAAIRGSRLVEMEGDHLLPLTRPATVNTEISRFLRTQPLRVEPRWFSGVG